MGIAKFVAPLYVIYAPDIMLVSADPFKAVFAVVMAIIGIWVLAGSACGFIFRELTLIERIIFFVCIPLTITPNIIWNLSRAALIAGLTVYLRISLKKTGATGETDAQPFHE